MLDRLPYDILENIFNYLSAGELTIASQICMNINSSVIYFQERKINLLLRLVKNEYSRVAERDELLEFSNGEGSGFDRMLYGDILRKYVKDYPYSTTVKINVVILPKIEIQRIIQ